MRHGPSSLRRTPAPRRRNLGDLLRHALRLRGAPEQIALGFAVGMFVAFTPTVGIQLVLVLTLATVLNANRIAAMVPIWITNVFTVPPVYAFTYTVGAWFMPGKSPRRVRELLEMVREEAAAHGWFNLVAQFRIFVRITADVFQPMLLGGVIVGAVTGAAAYPLALAAVRRYRRLRSMDLQRRARLRRRPTADGEPSSESAPLEESSKAP